jgi:hypothetical protein
MLQQPITLMLDSGAFSAWKKRLEINIDEYCDFCLKYIDDVDYVVNLDVIPGKFGWQNLPKKEVERSAEKGWKNYEYMVSKGIPKEKLIHVFHQNENFKWLKKMTKAMDYIGLSPANDRSTGDKIKWLDVCMNYVIGDDGYPLVKFHGFAVTSIPIMLRYPWYSVDSTTCVVIARHGGIIVPLLDKSGNCDYTKKPFIMPVSNRSGKQIEKGDHFKTQPEMVQTMISQYLKSKNMKMGKSDFKIESEKYKLKENERWGKKLTEGKREVEIILEEGVSNNYIKRDEINIIYFRDFEKSIPRWPIKYVPKNKNKGGLLQ